MSTSDIGTLECSCLWLIDIHTGQPSVRVAGCMVASSQMSCKVPVMRLFIFWYVVCLCTNSIGRDGLRVDFFVCVVSTISSLSAGFVDCVIVTSGSVSSSVD